MRTVLLAVLVVAFAVGAGLWYASLHTAPRETQVQEQRPATAVEAAPAPVSPVAEVPESPVALHPALPRSTKGEASRISVVIHGVVEAGNTGVPVAGATVRLRSGLGDRLATQVAEEGNTPQADHSEAVATTDEQGAYRLEFQGIEEVIVNSASLVCEGPGLARSIELLVTKGPVRDGQQVRQDFFLRPGGTISGRVTLADTGAPVKGVAIMAVTLNELWFVFNAGTSPVFDGISGEDGSYAITGLEEASYVLVAASTDRALILPSKSRPRVKASVDKESIQDLVVVPSATVRGVVRFPASDARPEYASLEAEQANNASDIVGVGVDLATNNTITRKSGELQADNTYEIHGLEYGVEYSVRLFAQGYTTTRSAKFTIGPGQSPMTIDLAPTRGSTLRGKAVYEDRKPATDVTLMLAGTMATLSGAEGSPGDFSMDNTTTGDDGSFAFENVPAGTYVIRSEQDFMNSMIGPDAADRPDESDAIQVDGTNDLNGLVHTLKGNAPVPGTGVITGQLLEVDGAPVAQDVIYAEGSANGHETRAHTLPDGTFRLERLSDTHYNLNAVAVGKAAKAVNVAVGSEVTLQFAPDPTVSGLVTDSDGNPVDACSVQVVQRAEGDVTPDAFLDAFAQMSGENMAKTDVFGHFEMKAPMPGRYVARVVANSAGFGESEPFFVVDAESKSGITIRLNRGVRLSGVVLDDTGKPVAKAQISLVASDSADPSFAQLMEQMPELMQQNVQSTDSDDAGTFAFQNLKPGDYLLRARAEGYAGASQDLTLEAGRDLAGHRIVLERGGCITGIAMLKGEAKAGVIIQATPIDAAGSDMKSTTSGDNGRFELCDLAPGNYIVVAISIQGDSLENFNPMSPTTRRAIVRSGETTDVDFSPTEGSVSVRGVVHGERGEITTVTLQKSGAPEPDMTNLPSGDAVIEMLDFIGGQAMCNADGAFVIDEVMPGEYLLQVHSISFSPDDIGQDRETLEERMKPAITQNVTVAPGTGLTLDLELPTKIK